MKHLKGCPSSDFGPCDCGKANASDLVDKSQAWDAISEKNDEIERLRSLLAASEARASEYFDRLGESVAKCMSIDEARQAAESQLKTARKVLDWVESWVSNPVGGYSVHALDGLFGMTRDKIATLHSLDGGISSTDDQSERIRRTDEMLKNTSS